MVHSGMECVGASYPLLNQMMLPEDEKQKKGIPPTEWYLFSSKLIRNPNVPKNAVANIKPKDFGYFAEVRRELMSEDKNRARANIYVDAEESCYLSSMCGQACVPVAAVGSVVLPWFSPCERRGHQG